MGSQGLSPINLRDFHVSEEYGFILQDPLEELPEYYKPWMSIAENLLLLIEAKQLRDEVTQMPELSVQHLTGYREQRLARLILSHITMGYVWQEGEQEVVKVLPRSLAVPYHQLSQALGLPLIMVHADLVLANWKRKDPLGNLSPIVCLPGGDSLRGFVLVTFLVEVAAVPGVKAVAESVSAVMREDEETLLRALGDLAESINQMSAALQLMFDYVDSAVFYNTIRPFLAGWRDNPAMPEGLIYEGASVEPLSFSGGSAAQSSVFHALDELLGIRHRPESADFLVRMRQYMPPPHRSFVEWVQGAPLLSEYVLRSGGPALLSAFNMCVSALTQLRSLHIRIVSKFVSVAGARARMALAATRADGEDIQQERGTGGSQVMSFLKSVRDTCKEGLLGDST
ncbi:indoleamine 2,3-dioxygenase 2 isoform X2 [Ascaphus truei]|uniref:indoleamine 2,3-dioxygenase 2 isoform X2 n=1 Tax=Ascaphus truei TaxID=8439 RepID=UPI003F5A764F